MYRSLCVFVLFFLIFASGGLGAKEPELENLAPGLKDKTVVLDIDARVREQNQRVIWQETHQRLTIPGRPIGMNLVGINLVAAVQFTPYLQAGGENVLVAQAQIWVEVPGQGIRYQTSMQTIPLDFNEPIYYLPLGSVTAKDSPYIEIMITLRHNKESASPLGGTPANAPGKKR
ncbi:MAG: hypothetical protein LBD47_09965 [Treponema sp.]|jgi:hypothetical protein|nr:hypothetical protein [Treponema sp.]